MKLKSESLDWSLKHLDIENPYTILFPKPFELEAIKDNWGEIKNRLLKISFPNNWGIREARRIFTPKHHFGYRIATQLDPIDDLIYLSLVYEIGEEIENSRIPKSQDIIFSNRFAPSSDGKFWDDQYNYSKFDEKTLELSKSGRFEYFVELDIADYFPRIYKHVLINSLRRKTTKKLHIDSIDKLISSVFQNVSYGIPVGNDASFLLAEAMMDSIDRRLLDEEFTYCRYVDDFRIFCNNKKEAYHHLEFLTGLIFNNFGLTLQQYKTKILPVGVFGKIHSLSINVNQPISQKFIEFLENEASFTKPYELINFERLTMEIREKFEEFNYDEILKEQLSLEQSNIHLIKFVLNTLASTSNLVDVQNIINHIDKFYPVMGTLMLYFSKITDYGEDVMEDIGSQFIDIISNTYLGQSKFIRMWIIHLFSQTSDWGGADKFVNLLNRFDDDFSKRELILAMGKAKKEYWFSAERKNFPTNFTSWVKRAFLRAYSCVIEDEKEHWYNSIKKSTLDILDKSVIDWAKKNPF